jgi:hypothetical protein
MAEGWRKFHYDELNYFLYLAVYNIIHVIKSMMRWLGHVTHVGGEAKCMQGFGVETIDHKEDLGISETIRKSTLKK